MGNSLLEMIGLLPENSRFTQPLSIMITALFYIVVTVGVYNTLKPAISGVLRAIKKIKSKSVINVMTTDCVENVKSRKQSSGGKELTVEEENELRKETKQKIMTAIERYIPTRFSSIDNSEEEEPKPYDTVDYSVDEAQNPLLISHLIDIEFDRKKTTARYYFCFADCGMGKTTFLINLWHAVLRKKMFKCLFVEGINTIEKIGCCTDKENTILLIDALDEIPEANIDFNAYFESFLNATEEFYKVVITCRTNFFLKGQDEPSNDLRKTGPNPRKGLPSAKKYYISPFNNDEIKDFLMKHYRFSVLKLESYIVGFREIRRRKRRAQEIVDNCPLLVARPLILHFIDSLVKRNAVYRTVADMYEAIFEEWVKRDRGKVSVETFASRCYSFARYLYFKSLQTGKTSVTIDEFTTDSDRIYKPVQGQFLFSWAG